MTGGEGGTIHIAPCSCELHQALREALERIRELEAELDFCTTHHSDLTMRLQKAETDLYFSKADALHYHRWSDEQFARAEKAEARVAELESEKRQILLGESPLAGPGEYGRVRNPEAPNEEREAD